MAISDILKGPEDFDFYLEEEDKKDDLELDKDDDKEDDEDEEDDDKKKDKDDDDEDEDEDKDDKKKDKDDDDEDDDDSEIKDEEVINSFILNEAAMDDLIALNEDKSKINFNNERKIKFVTKEQKLKKLTYKICILMAKKNNDADYKRWAKGRAIVVTARKRLMLKYKMKALARARQVIAAYRAGQFSGLLKNNNVKRDIAQPKGIQKT